MTAAVIHHDFLFRGGQSSPQANNVSLGKGRYLVVDVSVSRNTVYLTHACRGFVLDKAQKSVRQTLEEPFQID